MEQLWRRFRPYRLLAATALLTVGALLTGRLVELGRLDRDQRSQADSARTFMLEAADLDAALAWGRKAAVACRAPVEVRPFY